jgi:hypothetical protein
MAQSSEPTAAQALFPNLPSGERPERAQTGPRLSEAMYPRPSQPKPPTNSDRDSLLRGLRELNAKAAARLAREGRR